MFLYPISPLQLARQPIVPLTLRQMLTMGQGTLQRPDQIVHSARLSSRSCQSAWPAGCSTSSCCPTWS